MAPGRTAVLVPGLLFADARPRPGRARASTAVDPRDPQGEGLAAPLVLLPADEANGLEFDSVVVVEPALVAAGGAVGREGPPPVTTRGLRTLYVALTRPTRRLAVVHSSLPAVWPPRVGWPDRRAGRPAGRSRSTAGLTRMLAPGGRGRLGNTP